MASAYGLQMAEEDHKKAKSAFEKQQQEAKQQYQQDKEDGMVGDLSFVAWVTINSPRTAAAKQQVDATFANLQAARRQAGQEPLTEEEREEIKEKSLYNIRHPGESL
ncbi:hypothetical protein H2198_001780 [Neophaeococcomyces mojaviensis]|uniref:Uncharacterized protein n=1 Tax=Neophaeococcomyces mojaviensis TaxID=3383035 RepID=A0ACC3AGA5_9EURO|nr:hypothetical protein H2198_001780 [Knufia sp. JES_112]